MGRIWQEQEEEGSDKTRVGEGRGGGRCGREDMSGGGGGKNRVERKDRG